MKKAPAVTKSAQMLIRISDKDRATLQAAADARGLTLSAYVRMVALEAARKEQRK